MINNIFGKLKGIAIDAAKEASKHIPDFVKLDVPISEDMLQQQIGKADMKDVNELKVSILSETVMIEGKVKKLLTTTPFKLEMQPAKAAGRKLSFEVVKLSPLNIGWINQKIFNQPPYLSYDDSLITLDLNAFDSVSKVPVGSVHHFQINNGKLVITIGA